MTATGIPTLTLWQPYATLVVRGIKTIETRSWPCPPALIGQRFAIHAAAKVPRQRERVGDWTVLLPSGLPHSAVDRAAMIRYHDGPNNAPGVPLPVRLPLGAVVGSAVVTGCVPMVHPSACHRHPDHLVDEAGLWIVRTGMGPAINVEDQRPYGDFAPGRWAWLLADPLPTTEQCPACEGSGFRDCGHADIHNVGCQCRACPEAHPGRGAGKCEPIPARGAQRVWRWRP